MIVHYKFLYLPPKYDPQGGAPESYIVARRIIYAIKDGWMNGDLRIIIRDEEITVNSTNLYKLQQAQGAWTEAKAKGICHDYNFVPVPSKDDVLGIAKGKAASRFLSCLSEAEKPKVLDILRFTEKLQKASQGGPRYADQLYPKLQVIQTVAAGCAPIILLDDVVTSGGHLRACQQRLIDAGSNVVGAIVCGRTVSTVDADPYVASSFEVPDGFNATPMFDF